MKHSILHLNVYRWQKYCLGCNKLFTPVYVTGTKCKACGGYEG